MVRFDALHRWARTFHILRHVFAIWGLRVGRWVLVLRQLAYQPEFITFRLDEVHQTHPSSLEQSGLQG